MDDVPAKASSGPSAKDDSHDAVILNPRAPLATARIIVARKHMTDAFRTMHHQQAIFSTWTGTHYRQMMTEEMRSDIYVFLENSEVHDSSKMALRGATKPFNPTSKHVGETLDAMRAACQISGVVRSPAWLIKNDFQDAPQEIIACKNGLLHLPTGQIISHTPNFYTMSALNYDYDEDAPEPVEWLKFLDSVWPNDTEAKSTLREIFGYLLGTDTDQQKIPMIVGPKRSGKGTMARILTAMVGPDAVVSPTLSSLETNFGIAPLIGKSVALIADARLGGKTDQQRVAERLLSISGEDTQTIDRKHIDAWTGRLSARFFIMTNELPQISDPSGALASRFIILTMTKSFFGAEDHGLTNRLLAELPGILNWAISGWRALRARGYFLQPKSSAEAVQDLADLSSPISAFVRERCVVGTGRTVSVDSIYHAWTDWCGGQGRDHPGTSATFGKNLLAAFPEVGRSRPTENGERVRGYEGISLAQINKSNSEQEFNDRLNLG